MRISSIVAAACASLLAACGILAFCFALFIAWGAGAIAQTPGASDRTGGGEGARWNPPRTANGHPDIEGVWDFSALTPIERLSRFADRAFMTDEEAALFERELLEAADLDRPGPGGTLDLRGPAINEFWLERGTLATIAGRKPTSLIIDPTDGRLPALVPERATLSRPSVRTFNTVNDFALSERCLRSAAGPPFLFGAPDGNLIRITQSKDHVAIVQEKFHDPRIVSLDGRAHLPPQIRSWVGDSIGRWDDDTLVIDTTNFTDKRVLSRRFDGNLHLVERFTRVGPNTLLYEFTVEDPTFFTKPWTVKLPMTKTDDELYEYACHEGNYALPNILRGARVAEQN